jgi:hypothetical protein
LHFDFSILTFKIKAASNLFRHRTSGIKHSLPPANLPIHRPKSAIHRFAIAPFVRYFEFCRTIIVPDRLYTLDTMETFYFHNVSCILK